MHKAKHYCSFLCGKSTTDVKQFNHQNLATFGSGKNDGDEFFWNAVIRQSCLAGLLKCRLLKLGSDLSKSAHEENGEA